MAKSPKASTVPSNPLEGVDAGTLGRVLGGLDLRQVHRYADAGVIIRLSRGRYALFESIAGYCKHLREQAAGRTSADGTVDAMKANAEFKQSQRRLNDIKIQALEGKLIGIDEIEEVWGLLVQKDKQLFLSAAGRIRFDVPHLTGEDQEIIERTLRGMLEEVALTGEPRLMLTNANPSRTDDDA
jgi:phage terminase Nu1 subunit (DNA packaging protein)